MRSPDKDTIDRFLSYLLKDLGRDECHFFGSYESTIDYKLNRIEPFHEYKKTVGGYFDRIDHIRFECLRLHGSNGFVTINPVVRDKMRLASNHAVIIKGDQGAKNKDVSVLRHLFIDIDPIKPNNHIKNSATDAERAATMPVRDQIIADHGDRFDLAASGLWGKSGNGSWILARLPDYPNDEKHAKIVLDVLRSLAARYNGPHARIDTQTSTPSRVIGVAGTWKCKGPDLPERPWRLATVDGPASNAGGA